MSSHTAGKRSDGKLPVFVFPAVLNFFADDQTTHKQVITLYNPYEFALKFKVLCNNPAKYTVVEAEGLIKQKCCIDIVIRITDIRNVMNREDKFRIHLYEYGLNNLLGKKDVIVTAQNTGKAQKNSSARSRRPSIQEIDGMFRNAERRDSVIIQRSLPSIPVIMTSLACILVLMLPTQGDNNKSLPYYLHMSFNQKMIAAYILGLVTMAVLKT